MKISIIGAGNVGGQTAMRLAQEGLGEVVLVDVAKGLAQAKALDLEDCRPILKDDYRIIGTDDYNQIKDSDIVIVTAGLARKPGMTREDLIQKNAEIMKDVCARIKQLAGRAILIVVSNPLDIMTYLAMQLTGFPAARVLGMGVSLDAARFANLISRELNVSVQDIEAVVVGAHGEGMLPLLRFSKVRGKPLDQIFDSQKAADLLSKTVGRGAEIVSLLGSGSAYFAPSAAIAELVRAIAKDEKRTLGVCAYLNGEYGIKDVYIGVPARIGRQGIEKIIELDLNAEEKAAFLKAVDSLRQNLKCFPPKAGKCNRKTA
jgi:malate dehydrogenase